MALDLTIDNLVGAGGALTFLAVGALIVASRGGGARRILLAALCFTYALTHIASNVMPLDSPARVATLDALFASTMAAGLALVVAVARLLRPRDRVAVAALAVVAIVAVLAYTASYDAERVARAWSPAAVSDAFGPYIAAAFALGLGMTLVLALVAAAASFPEIGGRPRAGALLALAFGSFAAVNAFRFFPYGFAGTGFEAAAVVVLAALFWLPRHGTPGQGLRLTVLFTLLGLVLAGQILFAFAAAAGVHPANDLGINGVVRTAAALCLAFAILRERLFGIEPPAFALRRGPSAAAALAILFIVAQIAENYVDARFGLLTGGIVAGAFLFAAAPLQRAFERVAAPAAGTSPVRADASHEAVYIDVLRVAMRDKTLSREEEVHLHRLATKLGINAGRAHELLVEAEAASRGSGAAEDRSSTSGGPGGS